MQLELQTAELGNRLRRAFGIRGNLSVGMDSGAVPVVQIFDATTAGFRTSGQRFFTSRFIAAVAAQFGTFELFTPVGSGVVGVVDQLIFINTTATPNGAVWFATAQTNGSLPQVEVPELATPAGRGQGPFQSVGSTAAATGLGNPLGRIQVAANSSVIVPTEIAILPAQQLFVQASVANLDWGFSVSGRFYPVAE